MRNFFMLRAFTQKGDDLVLKVHVKAGAFQDEVACEENGELKIRIRAQREKGKANEALIKLLALYFDIPKSHIEITSGFTSPHKTVIFRNFQLSMVLSKMKPLEETT
jgi:uncharacterized protein